MSRLLKYLNDFLLLFFPEVCVTCGNKLFNQEKFICLKCLYDLPLTEFEKQSGNKVEQLFWGRVRIENAASFFYFRKGSRYQKLIHHLKYKGLKELGEETGKLFGHKLKECSRFEGIDLIMPVPLHYKKLKKRGFNQSEWIAKGISQVFQKPIDCNNLHRRIFTATQTRKTRFQRWENVENTFDISFPELLKSKHILLVDDVVTTGATLEACAMALLKGNNTKLSIVTLAYADL